MSRQHPGVSLAIQSHQPNHVRTDLWANAVENLGQKDRKSLETPRSGGPVVHDLLETVKAQRKLCSENQWKYIRHNGDVIRIRDCLDKVTEYVKRFREIGDMVMQYDTGHAALPWAGVRFLLNLAINDSETYCMMVEGIEVVSRFITQFAKVEELYLRQNLDSDLQRELEGHITKLYTEILTYLSIARRYYSRKSPVRVIFGALQSSSSLTERLHSISTLASLSNEVARLMDADYMRRIARFMDETYHWVGCDRLIRWLNATFTDSEFETAAERELSGTCKWILQRTAFLNWESTGNSMKLLWIHGPPGFGKTVLCTRIVQHLRIDHDRVPFFLCSSSDEEKKQPLAIVRSWIAQLLQDDTIYCIVRDAHQGKEGRKATQKDIWQIFKTICHSFPMVFVVDGLDECIRAEASTKEALGFLRHLIDATARSSTHILILSRDYSNIRPLTRTFVAESSSEFLEYGISIEDTTPNIKIFAENIVKKNLRLKSAEIQREMIDSLSKRSKGMFLWLQLVEDRIQHTENRADLQQTVREMPEGIENTYEGELRRLLEGSYRRRTINILRWTLFALRPLTVRELREALVIDHHEQRNSYPQERLPDSWAEEEVNHHIKALCGSLIDFHGLDCAPQDQTVHFVHVSVREYLRRSDLLIDFTNTRHEHDILAQTCLRFLTYRDALDGDYQFLNYAVQWHFHAHSSCWSGQLLEICDEFFQSDDQKWLYWSRSLQQEPTSQRAITRSPIYYASMLGFTGVLRTLLGRNQEDKTALHIAASYGRVEVLEMLLVKTNVDVRDQEGRSPLHVASLNGHLTVVQLLAERGAPINPKTSNRWTPLHAAAQNGHIEIVKFLHDQQAFLLRDIQGWLPMHWAALNGHQEVVAFLIGKCDMNAETFDGLTSLYLASRNGHIDCVRVLIEGGANMAMRDSDSLTALHAAAKEGYIDLVRLFAEKGADLDVQDQFNNTPAHSAFSASHIKTASAILALGANTTLRDGYGRTVLDWAAACGLLRYFDSGDHKPLERSQHLDFVRESMKNICKQLCETQDRDLSPGFHELGHCLMMTGDDAAACTMFKQQITIVIDEIPTHDVVCSGCIENPTIIGSRFVCRICPNVDLCNDCMEQYQSREDLCQNHEFLAVVGLSMPEEDFTPLVQQLILEQGLGHMSM